MYLVLCLAKIVVFGVLCLCVTYAGYSQTATTSSPFRSATESVAAGSFPDSGALSIAGSWRSGRSGEGLSEGVARMETLVRDLANELAISIGLDTSEQELDPEVVLAMARVNRREAGRRQ